jgi:hypothetical protein
MDSQPIFSSIEQLDSSIRNLTDFEKLRCKKAFSIPLSYTNSYLKKISTDDLIDGVFLISSLFVFLMSTSEKDDKDDKDDKDNKDKKIKGNIIDTETIFKYIKNKLGWTNKTLRYIICFMALLRITYELYMTKFLKIEYSLYSRKSVMITNLILIMTLITAITSDEE